MKVEGNLNNRRSAAASGLLPDGREWVIYPQMFTAKVGVGMPDAAGLDDVWCYATLRDAVAAIEGWDGEGEPTGWTRHPGSGRRRPRGNEVEEYVAR